MATSNCVIVGQKGRGGSSYSANAQYLGYYSSPESVYHDYVLSFTTGEFKGKSASITFNLQMAHSDLDADTRTYRWALLSSDANARGYSTLTNFYFDTHDEVVDENQIAQGTITWAEVNIDNHKTLTISTDALSPNTNYYLALWTYSIPQVSLITVASTQYHGDIFVEYNPVFSVELNHCLMSAAGEPTWYSRTVHEVEAEASFTPVPITPPSTHTQKRATFKAWTIGWISVVGEGVVGEDYITVSEDLTLEVYYFPAGSFIHVNVNGEAVKCEVYVNRDGEAVRCDVYANVDGSAVKM